MNETNIYQTKKTWFLLFLIIVLGAALRVYNLGEESYWNDEITMLRVAGSNQSSVFDLALGGRPPVYVLLAHFWIKMFGTS